ncbi:alpha/beta fold hydrolase [Actinoplanes sp. NPDC051513]|uniref:alpha/beta fold hydrolase n=1 Tax=Actinoplanes sp. NPDC051513 TaxID=3363908 RepID=UPI0037B283D3
MKPYQATGAVLMGMLTLAGAGASWQAIAGRRDRRRFPPPGDLVDVGGRRLHLVVSGEPSLAPTVILEAGMASMSANWAWVRRELAEDRRVVSYDRAGLGWSDPGGTFDAAASAADLHAALEVTGIGPPFVLAGHSYGGLVTRMFADRYPAEVAGMVLVDSSHPDQWARIPASRDGRTVALGNRMAALAARFGLLRLFRAERPFIAGLPAREYAEMRAYLARPQGWSAGADGLLAWARTSRAQVNATSGLGDRPLVVLSVTEQDRYAEILTRLQDELTSLSSTSSHRTVAGADHYTLVSKPEYAAVVSDAIRAVSTLAVRRAAG